MHSIIKGCILKELILLKYKADKVVLNLLSLITTIFILSLIVNGQKDLAFKTIILASTLTVGIADHIGLQEDFKSGLLEQYFLLPISSIKVIIVKWTSSLLQYSIITIPLLLIMDYLSSGELCWKSSTIYLLFITHLNAASLLINTICLGIKRNKGMLSSILAIPMIFPQIILSILSLEESLYLLLSFAISIIMIPLCVVFSTVLLQSVIAENN